MYASEFLDVPRAHAAQKLLGQHSQVAVLEASRLKVEPWRVLRTAAPNTWHPTLWPSPTQKTGLKYEISIVDQMSQPWPREAWDVVKLPWEEVRDWGCIMEALLRGSSHTLPKDPLLSVLGTAVGMPLFVCNCWPGSFSFCPSLSLSSPFLGNKLPPHPPNTILGSWSWTLEKPEVVQFSHSP